MKSISLGMKLIGAFVFVALVGLIIGSIGWWGVSTLSGHLTEVADVRLPSIDSLLTMDRNYEALRVAMRTLLNPELDAAARERQWQNIDVARAKYTAAMKIYEDLPQTEQEAVYWKSFIPALEAWRKANEAFFAEARKLEEIDILNPTELQRDIQQFTGDHYKLEAATANLILNGIDFSGGGDPAACGFGKWMAAYETSNPEMNRILNEVKSSHNSFHFAVRDIKDLVAKKEIDKAKELYDTTMVPAADQVFGYFAQIQKIVDYAHEEYVKMNQLAMVEAVEKQRVALDFLNKVVALNQDIAKESSEKAVKDAFRAKFWAVLAMVSGSVIALAFGIILAVSLSKSLSNIILSLSDGSEQVTSASGQVSSSSQEMAEGASEQASSLEEISSSLEEMTSMTRQNAENAKQANGLMAEAKD
ncbi:MAG: hypothetical protein EOM20_16945, partial [Spartobacteria bacterium]|nr:hypothetical protein [Spartobacteria bacterium]